MNATGWLALVIALGLLGAGVLVWVRAEGEAPQLVAPADLVVGAQGAAISLRAIDGRSGLRALRVALVHPGGEVLLLDESYPGNLLSGGTRSEHEVAIALDPARLGEVRGDARLFVSVRDWSWRGGFEGNQTRFETPLRIDLEPPRIEVRSGLTYVKQGGSGAVAYVVSEPTARDGVRVGTREYAGYPVAGGGDGERVALFAIPAEGPSNPKVRVFAEDAAGNASEVRWALVVQPRPLPESQVRLSRGFLEEVVPRLSPSGRGDAVAFHDVNTRVRAESEERVRSLIADTAPRPLFAGKLDQLANSKVTSRFGERRRYTFEGTQISEAIHYGYDLASFAAAPVTAAAAGKVHFAGTLGIYGGCVLLDHGLGLTTLYGHLSRIDVEEGESVERGQRLGLSGDTGLAGGDHLHFAVLVGDTYVDPLEWWDAKWVRTHVESSLQLAGP